MEGETIFVVATHASSLRASSSPVVLGMGHSEGPGGPGSGRRDRMTRTTRRSDQCGPQDSNLQPRDSRARPGTETKKLTPWTLIDYNEIRRGRKSCRNTGENRGIGGVIR